MAGIPGGPDDRGDEVKAAVDDAGQWLKQRGCLFWGSVVVMGLLVLGTCGERPDADPVAVASPAALPAPKPTPVVKPPADRAAAVAAWADDLGAAMRLCETASTDLSKALAGGNLYRVYDAAELTEKRCEATRGNLINVPVPDWFDQAAREAADKARQSCEASLLARRNAALEIKVVADGDQRPSAVAAAREAAQRVETMALGCAAGQMLTAERAGVSAAEFIKASEKLNRDR